MFNITDIIPRNFGMNPHTRVRLGKSWLKPGHAKHLREFRIRRCDPDTDQVRGSMLIIWLSSGAGRWCWMRQDRFKFYRCHTLLNCTRMSQKLEPRARDRGNPEADDGAGTLRSGGCIGPQEFDHAKH